jgi:inner membrane protein
MDHIIPVLGHWTWLVIAGVLLFLELMAPGVFFIWLSIAAGLTGVLDLSFGLSWQSELLVFAILAVVSVLAGRRLLNSRRGRYSDAPHLNQRMQGYVGQIAVLHEAIAGGHGKVTIDDSVWDVLGPDAQRGARVKIVGVDGLRLVVEIM